MNKRIEEKNIHFYTFVCLSDCLKLRCNFTLKGQEIVITVPLANFLSPFSPVYLLSISPPTKDVWGYQ